MTEVTKLTIRDVLNTCGSLNWSDSLFLPDIDDWRLDTPGIIWDPDDIENDEDEVPQVAKEHHLLCSLNISTIQSIVDNAKQQLAEASEDLLFEAFLYYWNNDAFITFHEK